MPSRTCSNCGNENPSEALRCSCGALLSRTGPGERLANRFRIIELKRREPSRLVYSIEEEATRRHGLLFEIFPVEVSGSLFERAAAVGVSLLENRFAFEPLEEFFIEKGCIYAIEAQHAGVSLAELVGSGKLAWDKAEPVFRALLDAVYEAASHAPPILHGALSASAIRFGTASADGPVFLAGSEALAAVVRTGSWPSSHDVLAMDLPALGLTILGLVTGRRPAELAEDAALRRKTLETLGKPSPAIAVLAWLTDGAKDLPSGRALLASYENKIAEALAAHEHGRYEAADKAFRAALEIYPATCLETWWASSIEAAQKQRQAEKARQTSAEPKQAVPPKPPTPSQPAPKEPQAPQVTGVPPKLDTKAAQAPLVTGFPPKTEPKPVATVTLALPPEPPPAPNQWFCAYCGTPNTPAATRCSKCMTSKGKTRPGQAKRRGRQVVLALMVLILLGGAVWYFSRSRMREFELAVEAGRLVTPEGQSAYDLYQKELADNQGRMTPKAQDMSRIARPKLVQAANTAFNGWFFTARLQKMTWKDMVGLEEWLGSIDNDPISRTRKEYAEGQVAFEQRRYADARAHYHEALKHHPGWDLALAAIGRAHFREGSSSEAERFYRAAVRASPAWVYPRLNLAELYLAQTNRKRNRLSEAEEQARAAVRIDRDNPGTREILGRVLYVEQKYEESCSELNSALRLSTSLRTPPFNVSSVERLRDRSCGRVAR